MKILNFGSCNIDYFYDVSHMVQPGETLSASALMVGSGGKGLNQSIALAKAEALVYHAGCIGKDGQMLKEALEKHQVNCHYLKEVTVPTGHAIIQRDTAGENSIILFNGANHMLTKKQIDEVLSEFDEGDLLLLQNETNEISYIIEQAARKGMQIALNPAPFQELVKSYPLEHITYFIVNEIEGSQMTGTTCEDEILSALIQMYPNMHVILTLGSKGVRYGFKSTRLMLHARKVKAIDTTAAGDTFIGYFLSGISKELDIEEALKMGIKASSITVTKKGSSESIPTFSEVQGLS